LATNLADKQVEEIKRIADFMGVYPAYAQSKVELCSEPSLGWVKDSAALRTAVPTPHRDQQEPAWLSWNGYGWEKTHLSISALISSIGAAKVG